MSDHPILSGFTSLLKKLDTQSHRQWELHSKGDDAQSMVNLKHFLEDRARALEPSASSSKLVKKNQESNKVQCSRDSTASVSCINCSEGHKLHQCNKFKIMSYEDKQIYQDEEDLFQLFTTRSQF